MCTGQGSSAIAMDSGVVDMRTNFGLNVKESDTVHIRRRTICNVLPREGHIFERPPDYLNRGLPADRWTLEYGFWRGVPEYQHPEVTFYQNTVLVKNQMSFSTTGMMSYVHGNSYEAGIIPLPEMHRNDADIVLIPVWPNAVVYEKPVDDPLFTAHRVEMRPQASGKDKALYWSDFPVGVVGCALQYQICYPRAVKEDYCTELGPSPSPEDTSNEWPEATPVQHSIIQLLLSINRITNSNRSPHLNNLRASKTVQIGISPGLPDDQWVQEIIGWEAFVWSGYQTMLTTSVIGPKVFDESGDDYRDSPTDAGDKQLCQSLKMRKAGGFANVNVFALIFLTTFSVVITLFNILILRFCIFLSKFRAALAPRIERWVQDGIFQLQRRAFEAEDEGMWVDLEKEIPVTKRSERLKELTVAPHVVWGKQSVGSFKTDETKVEEIKAKRADEDEQPSFRISVGRVDTGATLIEESAANEKVLEKRCDGLDPQDL
ncbi:hypothetical protein N0V90_001651 [Kalmusia sp. IMI 367209]|nr:hypothetical protein N0V90_001651 [Kalmusia sp. IMI 367209]